MESAVSPVKNTRWLLEHGPLELETLLKAIYFRSSTSGLPDDQGKHHCGAYLLDNRGLIAAWYPDASQLYGFTSDDVLGKDVSLFDAAHNQALQHELDRVRADGYYAVEKWQTRKDKSRFWAQVLTISLRDETGTLRGFARLARDFTEVRDNDEALRRASERTQSYSAALSAAAVVFGEFDRITKTNDAFLELLGYSYEDLIGTSLPWANLNPPEYAAADAFAHDESIRFGSCIPYEKELITKSNCRVPVRVVTAVVTLSPLRWVTFVTDLSSRNRVESVSEPEADSERPFKEMVGNSAALKRIMRQIEAVAQTDATVLILGETGTGKELVARAIHRLSPRHDLPCITLNCAAIPTGLLESELFGYERGAFTGALMQKIGRFEMAHRGTLFLDEVGDIPLDLQPKLLRALQEKAFERLGGTKTIPIDVRLVAATNRNLEQMMGDKLFRRDLYYRLKVFPITTPPLRDRPEDIPALARHFTSKYAAKMNRQIDKIPSETMQALVNWSWPGNVRELENFIERAVILSRGPGLRAPIAEIQKDSKFATGTATLEQVERDHIIRVFRESGGVVTTTATRLGLHRTTLNAMMRKLGISRHDL